MTAIADTSPLNYLILIGADYVLHKLYGSLLIPDAVVDELRHPATSPIVRIWLEQLPDWVIVKSIPLPEISGGEALGAGERAVMALGCMSPPPVLLLMDEIKGRAEARRRDELLRRSGVLLKKLLEREAARCAPESSRPPLLP